MAMAVAYSNFCGQLVHEDRGGTQSDYVADTIGSVAAILADTRKSTYEAEYWPYGEVRASTGTNKSPWGFVGTLGYYADVQSETLYVAARVFKPGTAQWLTFDPSWSAAPSREDASSSPFVYVGSNPICYVDPRGLQKIAPPPTRSPLPPYWFPDPWGDGQGVPRPTRGNGSLPMPEPVAGGVACVAAAIMLNLWWQDQEAARERTLKKECDDLLKDYHKQCGSYKNWKECNESMGCTELRQLTQKYRSCSAKRRLYKIKCVPLLKWDDEHDFPIDLAKEYWVACFNIWKDLGCDA